MKNSLNLLIILVLSGFFPTACSTQPSTIEASTQTVPGTSIDIPTTEESSDLSQSTSGEIKETNINIDGAVSDWDKYDVLLTDPEGDHEGGGVDIAASRAFTNDLYLYVLIETHEPPVDYEQVDINVSAGGREFILSFNPQSFSSGFMGDITGGSFEEIGEIMRSESAAVNAMEFKVPLSAFPEITNFSISVHVRGGVCCEYPDWYAIDETKQISPQFLNETESTPDYPQICADEIPDPIPFGNFEPVTLEYLEEGYAAEWFVAPGPFNMPQEIMLTSEGEILVYSIRSHELSELSLDGTITSILEDVWGYQGVAGSDGNIYLYMMPNGSLTRVSPEGSPSVIAQSPALSAACDSAIGFGPDNNLYIAVNSCEETSTLYLITPSGKITELAQLIDFSALRTAPDGRFIAATNGEILELSLEDYSLSLIGQIPGGDVSPGGIAFDDNGALYISTGSRSNSGKLFQMNLSDAKPTAKLIATIPENGISGIEWLPSTGEIIGGQLRQGGVLSVSLSGEISNIVEGNGIITPMGIGFSPCGELAVPNDDGGMLTLIAPDGKVSWLMDYLSFIPPLPYVAFDPDGTLYASEGEPMPNTPKRIAVLSPGKAEFLRTLVEAEFPSGLARRPDGVLFFSETAAGKITQIHPDGSVQTFVEGLEFPQALAFDMEGNLYAVIGPAGYIPELTTSPAPQTGDRVIKITPDGEITKIADLPGATGLAVSTQGNLFISVSTLESARKESKIVYINKDNELTTFASGFEDAVGLAFDLAGNLYVSDEHANGILRINGFPQGILSGIVIDESGELAEGARVQVHSSDPIVVGQVVYTDSNGEFSLPAAPRVYSLHITYKDNQEVIVENVEVFENQEILVEIQ